MHKAKVLIVEDESLIALQLEIKLSKMGYDICQLTASGEDAIRAAQEEQPDIILMDIRLVGAMDGIEAARQIGQFSSIPVIFTTGYPDIKLRERAMLLNPSAFLIKPIEIQAIEKVIRSTLNLKFENGYA